MRDKTRRFTLAASTLCLFALAGCGPSSLFNGPTSSPDVYTGTWRGSIEDFTVAIRLDASRGFGFSLTGDATFTRSSTQNGGTLSVIGIGSGPGGSVVLNFVDKDAGPSTEFQGQISGTVEARTLRGRFRGTRSFGHDYDGVFGVEDATVTFVRE